MKKLTGTIHNFSDVPTKCLNNTESQDLSSGRWNHVVRWQVTSYGLCTWLH